MSKDDNSTDKSPAEIQDRIWELAERIDFCMFTTWDGERQRSRPLSARVRQDEHAIYFLVDAEGEKNWQVDKFPWVSCAWAVIDRDRPAGDPRIDGDRHGRRGDGETGHQGDEQVTHFLLLGRPAVGGHRRHIVSDRAARKP